MLLHRVDAIIGRCMSAAGVLGAWTRRERGGVCPRREFRARGHVGSESVYVYGGSFGAVDT